MTSDYSEIAKLIESAPEQLAAKLGIHLVEYGPDRVVATMPVAGNRQPYGLLHGGANAALAEQVGSIAAALSAGEGRVAVGLELLCTHHRAATEGEVTAVASPLHRSRSTATYDIAITDDQDRRTCSARLTCVIRDAPPK
ncbi:PaaI family thioesterase [Saccharopolyspora griseoalba]|uniref:PaaI family thioesterase n=1 Tax=Saccharopolyspora griseoalba TaxID=1431848 RepID=A0ABW2LPI0_9PSEU